MTQCPCQDYQELMGDEKTTVPPAVCQNELDPRLSDSNLILILILIPIQTLTLTLTLTLTPNYR